MTATERGSTSKRSVDSRYVRLWTTTACLAAAMWIAVAVAQSPRGSLSLFVLSLSFYGGLLVARTPLASAVAMRRFLYGILATSDAVLMTVGIGHHVAAGLASAVALGATSPALLRRIPSR